MKITIFGLTITSSWGNGHATPYRALLCALHRQGVVVSFYEKDVPYYAIHRDLAHCDFCDVTLYASWDEVRSRALREAAESDIVIVASYCPEGARISDEVLDIPGPLHVFYDLDTPITLERLTAGGTDYLRREQVGAFDLYLSFTGGSLLGRLEDEYGARMARPLYGCVDPDVYHPVAIQPEFACALSYMGTYAPDRQDKLDALFLGPARWLPDERFLLAGCQYPSERQWPRNISRFEHIAPVQHPSLYSSSRATLNITRQEMAGSGFCPSGRFFEAAACGTAILSDWWNGLDSFFDPWREIAIVRSTADVLSQLQRSDGELQAMAKAARLRTLSEHTGKHRALELLAHCEEARHPRARIAEVTA